MRKLFTTVLISLACCSSLSAKAELREVNFCKQPGARCGSMETLPDEIQAELEELFWCCPYQGSGDCDLVANPSFCDPEAEYLVYCEWGRTVPQSSQTGSVDCYG